jgi:uncharacterized membrane protein
MFVSLIVSAFSQSVLSGPAYGPVMNIQPPNDFRGGRPFFEVHQVGGPSALAWTIFALQLLLLAAIAVLIARSFAFRPRPAGPPRRFRGRPDPLTHARMRYANGEISREEYLQVTHDLGGTREELPPD